MSLVSSVHITPANSLASAMVDNTSTVCCMCGDVGFSDKLFHCTGCRSRFQHSYCSSYYVEPSEANPSVCDWCKSEERSSKTQGSNSKRSAAGATNRSEYLGEKIKQKDGEESSERSKNTSGSPSPKPSGRRYKLLKDVLC